MTELVEETLHCPVMRWVRKNRRIYAHSSCTLCGTAWGGFNGKRCPATTCLACGSVQCLGNGLGRGQCSICLYGILPGWSGSVRACGYKGCKNMAVASAPRVNNVCLEHLGRPKLSLAPARVTLDVYINRRKLNRDIDWMLVAEPT